MRRPTAVDPRLVVEPGCFNYKSVPFPPTDRIPEPRGFRACRQGSAIREDLAPVVELLNQNGRHHRRLNDLERYLSQHVGRNPRWEAFRGRNVSTEGRLALITDRACPGCEMRGTGGTSGESDSTTFVDPLPDSCEIDLAVQRSRGRSRKVGFAIRQTRDPGRRVVQPLRV